MLNPKSIQPTYFARTNARVPFRKFGIKEADRFSHMYVVGKTGTGKSTFLETLISQDINRGNGCALIDPHGDLVERIASSIPDHRKDDVIYLNVPDPRQPYGYNPLQHVSPPYRSLAASGFMDVFKGMWQRYMGVRMEHVLRNALLALLEHETASLPDVLRLLQDKTFRRAVTRTVSNPQVRSFWQHEFEGYSRGYRGDAIAPIQNKVGAFLADPTIRRILTSAPKPIRLRSIMDEGKILLVNLARGRIGSDSASLLGGLLVTSIGLAAFSRADMDEYDRRPYYLYLDEFQNVTTLSIATMISELRKYRVGLILAHQYLDQLDKEVLNAVIGNAGTLISFRLGAKDAGFIARELEPKFYRLDLVNLPNYDIYLRLMIDGMPSKPFSATTLLARARSAVMS